MTSNFSQAGYLKSMTAYGRGVSVIPFGRFTVEIQSVNRRFLEVNVGLPRLFFRFETDVRKAISSLIGRGMVNVSVSWKTDAKQPINVTPNLPLAKGVKRAWETLTTEVGVLEPLPWALLAEKGELFLYEEDLIDEEMYRNALMSALQEALNALLLMKQREGETLARDVKNRIDSLGEDIVFIEAHAKEAPEKYRQKLHSRLQELFAGHPENEERILREIAVYAERIDITEEIVRFRSHLEQFSHLLTKPLEESRGKALDFLLQELHREINTIGSKSSDLGIVQRVVAMKSELEKIREQVQNIE